MNTAASSAELADSVAGPSAAPRPASPSRRLPLRATGLLAIAGATILALLLVASTLVFRSAAQANLEAFEQAQARHSSLLERRLDQSGGLDAGQQRDLDRQLRESLGDGAQGLAQTRHYIDGVAVTIACLAWLGITCVGALAMLFFSRLALDIGTVRARALAIVVGDRGRSQPLARNDELSDLAQAVDNLAGALGRRERDLEIERRHVVHQEQLAAIGSMAAGVLREIGNPIAAIDGYARALVDAQRGGEYGRGGTATPLPGQILHEAARLVAITREISQLAAAPASQWQLASLNEIVAQSIALLRYEPRVDGVTIVPVRDPQLPAVMAIADRLVLLLINLLINAADAAAALPAHTARIEVATRSADGGVELCVSDNGCGMTAAVLERAFEPLFTTKPAGRGTGLGLPLCRSIVQAHGGRIDLQSVAGKGTRVTVWLPLPS